jgi:hypothetical protein
VILFRIAQSFDAAIGVPGGCFKPKVGLSTAEGFSPRRRILFASI